MKKLLTILLLLPLLGFSQGGGRYSNLSKDDKKEFSYIAINTSAFLKADIENMEDGKRRDELIRLLNTEESCPNDYYNQMLNIYKQVKKNKRFLFAFSLIKQGKELDFDYQEEFAYFFINELLKKDFSSCKG